MKNWQNRNRRSIRLKGYNYSTPGLYFITICLKDRECLFGKIIEGEMILNDLGLIIKNQWKNVVKRYDNVSLDEYTIMPNHLHGIVIIEELIINVGATLAVVSGSTTNAGARPAPTTTVTLGDIIGSFKSLCIHDWLEYIKNKNIDLPGKFWQRNYYEHIIRNEKSLKKIRRYIIDNPLKWENDIENLQFMKQLLERERNIELEKYYNEIILK